MSLTADVQIGGLQANQLSSLLQRAQQLVLRSFVRLYPWVNGGIEALRFTYQLMYLLDSTPFFSPDLQVLQQTIVRVSGNELVSF
jgi:Pex2 / Pex12 amino terminal region